MTSRDPRTWQNLACQEPLAAVLDLDADDVPLSTSSNDSLDRALLLLFDALHDASVQVVVISRRHPRLAAALRAQAPTVWWFDDPRVALATVRDRLPGVHVVLIGGDGEALLGGRDLRVAVGTSASNARGQLVLEGVTAVRAMLWWLVNVRGGGVAAEVRSATTTKQS